jgi:cyclophilin family peptidyl-prolyl cis-trans isomerase
MKRVKNILKNKGIAIFLSIALVILFTFFVMKMFDNLFSDNIIVKTSMGDFIIELYPESSPVTVDNFLDYVDSDFYDGLVFHRIINGFMIQGGGFEISGIEKKTNAPIKLESNNNLSNQEYTISMARTMNKDSATSQFFINVENNAMLDYSSLSPGYAVFGKVIDGTDIVDKIKAVETITKNGMKDWPTDNVVIYSIERI